MKRTALKRKTPLARTAFNYAPDSGPRLRIGKASELLKGRSGLRAPGGTRTRIRAVALKRGGASMDIHRELSAVCRAIVMTRAGATATLLPKANGSGFWTQWTGRCESCGNWRNLQWAHFIGRACHRVKWEPTNSNAFCGGCHMQFDQHRAQITRESWQTARLGEAEVRRLHQRKNAKFRIDYELTLILLKDAWKGMTGRQWNGEQGIFEG